MLSLLRFYLLLLLATVTPNWFMRQIQGYQLPPYHRTFHPRNNVQLFATKKKVATSTSASASPTVSKVKGARNKAAKSSTSKNTKSKATVKSKAASKATKLSKTEKSSTKVKKKKRTKTLPTSVKKPTSKQKSTQPEPKATKRKIRKKKSETIKHWIIEHERWFVELRDHLHHSTPEEPKLFRWTIGGNPLPLQRHRTSRGFMYNPSAAAQASFQNITEQILSQLPDGTRKVVGNNSSKNETVLQPLFPPNNPLIMTIVFRMKRPKCHFVGNKPGPGRLRENAPSPMATTRTDVDNLAKFVLDSMNGILYEDDRQISSLHVTKIYDNEGLCQGSTEVCCRIMEEEDLPTLIENSFDPFHKRIQ